MSAGDRTGAARPATRWRWWRPALREERQLAVLWGVLAVSALLLRPLWIAIAPALPPCPFRALTGVPCLTCGATRAAVAVLHGRPLEALLVNPLAVLAGLGFIAGGLVAPLWALLDAPVPHLPTPTPRALRLAIAVALLADWAWVLIARV